jgi:hypothetical protein
MTPPSRPTTAVAVLAAVLGSAAGTARGDCTRPLETKIIPLPVWGTSPNEGNTWGVMPVFMRVCPGDGRTVWLTAPSVTWNSVIHYTATLRFYDYPDPDTTLTVIASASTRINYRLVAQWQRLPVDDGAWTDEAMLRIERNAFARFYGLGPDTPAAAQTSYTGARVLVSERRGRNLFGHLNLGVSAGFERDAIEDRGVPGLPLAPEVFPDAPGMRGATLLWQGLDLRYDDRIGLDYAEQGVRLEVSGAVVEGIAGSPTFLRGGAQARGILPELSWLSGAARVAWSAVTASGAPFYQQSTLGGELLLRGFTEGRFVDRQAWTIEAEQRIRVLQTHIFGVLADWRADPFVAAGQVFGSLGRALSRPQVTTGVGLRAFVHPNLVGRVDLATGGEGLSVYVEIGYPY